MNRRHETHEEGQGQRGSYYESQGRNDRSRNDDGDGPRGNSGYAEQRGRQNDRDGFGESHASRSGGGSQSAGQQYGQRSYGDYPGQQGYGGGAQGAGSAPNRGQGYSDQDQGYGPAYGNRADFSNRGYDTGFSGRSFESDYDHRADFDNGRGPGRNQELRFGRDDADSSYGGTGSWRQNRNFSGQSRGGQGYVNQGYQDAGNGPGSRAARTNYYGTESYAGPNFAGGQGYGLGDAEDRGYGLGQGHDLQDSRGWRNSYGQYAQQGQAGAQSQRGRGPKGYQRSDERLQEDISERLAHDHDIDASDITVTVKAGVVTLEGTISDRRLKHRVEDLAESCSGVKDVDNRITVKRASSGRVSQNEVDGDEESTGDARPGGGNATTDTVQKKKH